MKALVLISGGIDSTTCLALAVSKYGNENVVGLSIYYGQRHDKEIQSADSVCNHYNVEHIKLNLSTMFEFSNCSLLQHSNEDIPEESYDKQLSQTNGKPVSTYVPFRNGLFLSSAAAIALSKDCSVIYYGAHADDAAGNAYPDCSPAFNNAMNSAIYEGSGKQLQIEAPFINLNKAGVVKMGLELGVPYELTWSCYEGHKKACGKCGTCIDRKNAFLANGVTDPIEYAAHSMTQLR
jgi:7-cyano-7-deazaguanine synthase